MGDLTHIFGPGIEGLSIEDAAKQSTRFFVRSEGQLAVYEASRNPTGHMLTAWEAFAAYGLEVLEDAVEFGSAILKRTKDSTESSLHRRREALDLSYRSVAKAAKVRELDVRTAESSSPLIPVTKLERIAFTLGLDERLLAFRHDSGGDPKLAYRLKTLVAERAGPSRTISSGTALLFAEASSIIRVQLRFQRWLGLATGSDIFKPYADYGSPEMPAWRIGYNLAKNTRKALGLGDSPIESMRELVENRLGIPVIQARLPNNIAGATVMTAHEDGQESRGVVLNTVGDNENVWVRRATLAHELGHLLYDPDESLQNVRVDSYSVNQEDPETQVLDFVEQRANAFAISFLAPNDAVRNLAPTPVSEESVSEVMRRFGISHTSARYHIANSHYRQFHVPERVIDASPSDEQKAAENFTVDFFPLQETPDQYRGRFADLVMACYGKGIISGDTAALYLRCSVEDFQSNLSNLRMLYEGYV